MITPPSDTSPVVAVIDLGSNSIKALVATRHEGGIRPLFAATRETRVGAGMAHTPVCLHADAMAAAAQSVKELVNEVMPFQPDKLLIVGTSAVREAVNQADFARMILEVTGHPLVILSGEEEARGIAQGVVTDPFLLRLPAFSAFDLGGGSLECIRVEQGQIIQAISLPLGAVRLTEKWVADKTAPLTLEAQLNITQEVQSVLEASGFPLIPGPMVGTSGAFTISRSILAYRLGRPFMEIQPILGVPYLKALFREVSSMGTDQRLCIPKLPTSRVDIFPTALLTVLAIAERLEVDTVFHSQRNLRFGLACGLLS